MPLAGLYFLTDKDPEEEGICTLMIYPLNPATLKMYREKKNKSGLQKFLQNINFVDYGYLEVQITMKSKTSTVGNTFRYVEIQNFKKIRKTKDKIQALNQLRA